jgi:acyl-[acyl-carrier-protein]-phospholipid O-acyltransferase / long-chain-fatty-acid--[acyl-carrier-protein] ligase
MTMTDARMSETPKSVDDSAGGQHKVRISSPRFQAFLAAQFLGAANDSAFKMTLVLLILSAISGEARQLKCSSLATGLFPIPFLLFSPLAGFIADRFNKHRVLFWTKCPEIAAMALAMAGFASKSIPFLMGVLFFTATHSAFFSPSKYGILPEVFENQDLSAANGILEMTTDIAILVGSILGVYVYAVFHDTLVRAGFVFLVIACLGTIAIIFAPRAPAGNRDARFAWNVFSSFRADLREVSRIPALYYSVVGIAWFGFLGSFFLTVIPVFGRDVLALPEKRVGGLLAVLSIGVGLGSVLAGRLSRKHVELGLVPLGSLGITLFALLLARAADGHPVPLLGAPRGVVIELVMLGLSSGFYIIPLNAMLQERAPSGMKGRLVAFSNVLTFMAVLAAAAIPWLLTSVAGLTIRQTILFVAVLTFAGTIYVVRMLPDFLVRLVIWLATNSLYRIRTVGIENVPKEGALFVANHVSWIDALLVAGSRDRMVRFLMFRPYYEMKGLNWFFRRMHAIPVASNDPPERIRESLALARREIQNGHVVCIFAEGAISRIGNLLKFRRGLERIAFGVNCPIVPVYLDGIWGSIFSFERGRFLLKRPKRILEPVTVLFGRMLASTSSADQVRGAMQELSVEAFRQRKGAQRPVGASFIRRAKRRWFGVLATEAGGVSIRFGASLVRAILLSRRLWGRTPGDGERVGILMRPGIGALLANLAAYLADRVPVNLDPDEHPGAAASIIAGSGIREVLTSRELQAQSGFNGCLAEMRLKCIEEIASDGALQRAMLGLACFILPARILARAFMLGDRHDVDRLATVLYSYSSDEPHLPRGAMLSHHNLLSNLESLRRIFHVTREDCILGLLSFSNSIGFAATLLLPAMTGARVAYGDSTGLGRLCRENRVSLIPATPEKLRSLVDQCSTNDLFALRRIAVGGAPLGEDLRRELEEKFGVEPLEGYGHPECALIISLNVPDYVNEEYRQAGMRRGTAGQPLPGISLKIADPATFEQLPTGREGILLVSGPNVMRGYVNGSELTRKVMIDGWYNTGDLASLDADGFLTVAGRAR